MKLAVILVGGAVALSIATPIRAQTIAQNNAYVRHTYCQAVTEVLDLPEYKFQFSDEQKRQVSESTRLHIFNRTVDRVQTHFQLTEPLATAVVSAMLEMSPDLNHARSGLEWRNICRPGQP